MEYSRYNLNNRYRRDYQSNPYERGPPRRGREAYGCNDSYQRPPLNRPGHSQNTWQNPERTFENREACRPNDSYQRPHFNRPGHSHNTWQDPERTFDNRGREVFVNQRTDNYDRQAYNNSDCEVEPHLTPLEYKARNLCQTVLNQEGIRSKLIFLETVDNALQTLQGTVDNCQLQMAVNQKGSGEFVLMIDKEEVTVVKGEFSNKQAAKNALAEQAMNLLKKDCFYIVKKKVYEEVSTKTKDVKEETQSQSTFAGNSKAHQMMLKMGWGGKGLGVNEQGAEKTVAETIDQNISRQGLGTGDVFKKIHKLLEDYSKSDKITLLRFDPDFTSEERAHIHKIASKFGLKSKSEGKGEQRRITITKKLHRGDLVYTLLTCGLENSLYKLLIPAKFEYLWRDEEDDDEDPGGYPAHFSS